MKLGATLITDGHAAYPGLSGDYRRPRVVGNMAASIVLPWSHRAFCIAEAMGVGDVSWSARRKHVDAYLNEFVFRYNRRFHRHVSFETRSSGSPHAARTYRDIVNRDADSQAASEPIYHL